MSKEIRSLVDVYKTNDVTKAIELDEKEFDELDLPDQSKYGKSMIPIYHGMEKAIYSMGDTINELTVENGSLKEVLKSDPNKLKQALENRDNRLRDQTNKQKNEAIFKACTEAVIKRQKGFNVTPALIYGNGTEEPKSMKDVSKIRKI